MRLKELRINKGYSQQKLADKVGVSRSTISMWEINSSQPDNEMLIRLALLFEVSTDYLLGRTDERTPSKSKGIKIPVLGTVVAGIPIDAVEEILDYEEITPELAATGEFFALRVKGSSMEPRIMEGDVVIVRKQETADTGDIAIVLVNGDEATVKKIRITPEGITLIALNPTYSPLFYTSAEVDSLPVRIIGKVVELRGKF